jgi:CheY-specific phosphatase CheX
MRLRCRLLTLIAVGVLLPAGVKAQSSVTLTGHVSEVVTLSVAPNSTEPGMDVVSNGGTVRITLSGDLSPAIRVPLLVRSNTGFKISANFESATAVLSQISVDDVRATGGLVAPNAITELNVPSVPLDLTGPFLVSTGPRVSIGGTLDSPNNALQITLLIRLNPSADRWTAQLNLVATK